MHKNNATLKATYLGSEMEIAEQDGGFARRDYKNNSDKKDKSEHVIELMRPTM